MNACLNLVKALLASVVRNDPKWLLKFLALEALAFLAQIHFLDLAIFWPFWPLQPFCAGYFSPWSSTCILRLPCSGFAGPAAEVVFSMEVSGAASLLNLWINRR